MAEYLITWEIVVDADSRVEAAREALAIQRDREAEATVFKVDVLDGHGRPRGYGREVDLSQVGPTCVEDVGYNADCGDVAVIEIDGFWYCAEHGERRVALARLAAAQDDDA